MMLGLTLVQFTQLHVLISLIAITAGVIFFLMLLRGRWLMLTNGLFLIFTILTMSPASCFRPSRSDHRSSSA